MSKQEGFQADHILSVKGLEVCYGPIWHPIPAVRGVSFDLKRGEIMGLVGESGSGKSTIGYAIMQHLGAGRITAGSILFDGADLMVLRQKEISTRYYGRRIGFVFQEPQQALNPSYTVGEQVAEGLRFHFGLSQSAARTEAVRWLEEVGLPEPSTIYDRYPHQISGGQLQRVVIAAAFSLKPDLVVMDEPTTGLDTTTQARILRLVADLRKRTGVSILYVSHDLGVVADVCDSVIVLNKGRIVESGAAREVLSNPSESYTRKLVAAIPDIYIQKPLSEITIQVPEKQPAGSILRIERLCKDYRHNAKYPANNAISFSIARGETLALIGESGSGKSTLAKCVLGLEAPTGGRIEFTGDLLPGKLSERSLELRRRIQIIFQNPDSSLNPKRTIGYSLARPLLIHKFANDRRDAARQAVELLESVELSGDFLDRYPGELSGGQKQRVAIARALASKPNLIVCDEPVSALDVSVQATVLDLLRRLQAERGLSYLFITHDLGVVRQVADRAVVLLRGEICYTGDVDALFALDNHPYVRELIAAVPGRSLNNHDHRASYVKHRRPPDVPST
ncbi:ABC transporter ATP-binding protein [Microvirga sp. VF16]|uniref:dipeptide ABC transporter ATP-binding protein n=1 Tax=Microvirga sp. VF16 TaxID=2807101 RepID=UPI00193D1474|nr:ABC transporter ATP-binding protein [Microvirga sp. VF16]QRM33113.1 ABC transporter ATP-binding protein [Microvirga sp. VF16]